MRKSRLKVWQAILLPALFLTAAAPLLAQSNSLTVAFVDTGVVLEQTEEGSKGLAELDAFVADKRQQVEAKQTELQNLQQQFESQSRLLNADTRAEMQSEIEEKQRQLQRIREDIQVEVNTRQNRLLTRASQRIKEVVSEYAQANGIGAVFVKDPSYPFVSPAIDITDEIVAAYNSKYPGSGGQTSNTP